MQKNVMSARNYAVAGYSMANGGIGKIPPSSAIQAGSDIKLIVMDGGGNDILLCDTGKFPGCNTICKMSGSSTQKVCLDIVSAATTTAAKMMTDAATAGVKDIVYFFYPHLPGANQGYNKRSTTTVAISRKRTATMPFATTGTMTCHFVDNIDAFAAMGGDHNAANFVGDSIHPSQQGQTINATNISNTMKAACVGQSADSGCCAP